MRYVSPWMQAALLPHRYVACGVRCRPLTVWPWYALGSVGNPYMCGGATTPDALCELLLYASRGIVETRLAYYDRDARASMLRTIERKVRRMPWDEADAQARGYVDACARLPGHRIPETGPAAKGRKIAAPFGWVLVEYLTGRGMAIDAAWNMPISRAVCLFDAGRDARGEATTLITEADEERIDERLAKRAAGKGSA